MLFKSGLVTQVSGSIGGMTGSRNKGGFYFKAKPVPVNPNTPAQLAARIRFQGLSTNWTNLLTDAQRTAWNAYATTLSWTNSLGDAIQLSGQNVFIGGNSLLNQAGNPEVADAPIVAAQPTQDVAFTGVSTATGDDLTIAVAAAANNDWASVVGDTLLVYASRGQSAGKSSFNGPWQFIGQIDGEAAPTFPIIAIIPGPFPYVAGDRVFVQTRVVLTDSRYSFPVKLGSNIAT